MCLTLPIPESPVQQWLRSVYNMRSLNQFGCCTLKPNTFPTRTTGGVGNVIRFTHAHLGCNVLEWCIHTWKKRKKEKQRKTSKKKKRQKIKRTQKHIYVQCRLWCKWHNRWKRMNFLRETINIVLYSFILSACFVVFFCKYGILKMLLLIIEKKKRE